MSQLYLSKAQEAGLQDRSSILKRYQRLFNSVDSLFISMSSPSINIVGNTATVETKIMANHWYRKEFSGKPISHELVVVNTQGGLRISSLQAN